MCSSPDAIKLRKLKLCDKWRARDRAARHDATKFIDRFGRLHTAAVLRNWSPAALAAMRVIPFNEKETPSVTER